MPRLPTALCVLLLASAPARAQEPPAPDSLALARLYTQWLYAGVADSLVAHASPATRASDGPDAWRARTDLIAGRAGVELGVLEETWKRRNGRWQYWRVARFSGMDEPLLVRWVLNGRGEIDGIGLGPLSQAPRTDR